jgi:phosphoenolpyruvate carboxykinase (ATP)
MDEAHMTLTETLRALGLENLGVVHDSPTTPELCEAIVSNREGRFAHMGALVVQTGHDAERSARDTFVVATDASDDVGWLGGLYQAMSQEVFDRLLEKVRTYLRNKDLYVQDCCAAMVAPFRVDLRVVTETAWHSLLARTFYWPHAEVGAAAPAFTVVHVPRFQAIPERDGTASSSFTVLHPRRGVLLIGGTGYGGEIRRAVSTACRWLHGSQHRSGDVLPLRCAVSVGEAGDVAAFLGRTGTGKTALAADEHRRFAGDHEHGWGPNGLFPYERGCYARVLGVDADGSRSIREATRRFGAILENVSLHQATRRVDFEAAPFTANTRAAFPRSHLPRALGEPSVSHPKNLFLLTRDNLGVLPPIARLDTDQAGFAFLTSYVSSLAETDAEPGDVRPTVQAEAARRISVALKAARPGEYAKRFMEKVQRHEVRCWFVNTGSCGEPLGRTDRIDLAITRTLVRAALEGALDAVPYEKDPLFQFAVPRQCPGVDADQLDPRKNARDEGEYELRANRLALDFIKGFERFELEMPDSVREMVASVPILDEDLDLMEQMSFSI